MSRGHMAARDLPSRTWYLHVMVRDTKLKSKYKTLTTHVGISHIVSSRTSQCLIALRHKVNELAPNISAHVKISYDFVLECGRIPLTNCTFFWRQYEILGAN